MTNYIEGKRPVIEALRTNMPLKCVLMADNLKKDGLVEDIERKAHKYNVPVKQVPRKKLDGLSERGSHQGVMAEARPFQYANVSDVVRAANDYADQHEGRALVVILDHITDAGNLGAIARSANAVGASGLIVPNKRAAGVTAATYKSSAGAISHVPCAQVSNLVSVIERCKKEGFWVAGASEQTDGCLWDANLKGKIALVMGNEQEGLSQLVKENCDFFIALPQLGQVESLNVAQASTACMYEWLRQNW
ncbi:MAG: 23S rRNA (guanosine(2251)-2'-O)-methyltransferase RlmB [Coriobacteriia bacterium]|nr:23S rRNA (guanosine(2251)-2'-O)-methyltransferase RlmB [Coriobacteriia bacterium]